MFQWQKEFETNIKDVDQQHQYLINLINELNAEVIVQREYDNYDKIMKILVELKEYTIGHFKQEEQMMKDAMGKLEDDSLAEFWNYFKIHRGEHKNFIGKIEEIENKDIDEDQDDISIELIDFLIGWLKNHILEIDKQLTHYI